MKHINIDKIFVVNLDDKIHRWKHFETLDGNVERIPAVDSRKNWYVYEDYDLDLVPYGRNNDHYFTQSKGAVGCYLSHYNIWKAMLEQNLNWCLVLEDDAEVDSVRSLLSTELYCNDDTNVLQLNKRSHHMDLVTWFNGTESYALDAKAAEILINATQDFSYFEEEPCELLPYRVKHRNLHNCEYVVDTIPLKYCWKSPNSIRIPADKLIGYCGHSSIPVEKRLGLESQPIIDLHENLVESDVTDMDDKPHWQKSCEELAELEQRSDYEWWFHKERHIYEVNGLHKLKDFSTLPTEDSISLISVIRNEELLLPHFIEYYSNLGVTHFTFIDNDSTDKTVEYLISHDDVDIQLYSTQNSYSENEFGVGWVNLILENQFKNKWCLVVDVDELLMLGDKNLTDLKKSMIKRNSNILITCLLDFYPANHDKLYERGGPYLEHSNHCDKMTSQNMFMQVQDDNSLVVKGGMRHRVYTGGTPTNEATCLTKKSFFKYDFYDSHKLSVGMHWIMPKQFVDWLDDDNKFIWKSTNQHLKFFDEICILGHFKYLKPNIAENFKERIERNEDWGDSSEYKTYIETKIEDFFNQDISIKYKNYETLYTNTVKLINGRLV